MVAESSNKMRHTLTPHVRSVVFLFTPWSAGKGLHRGAFLDLCRSSSTSIRENLHALHLLITAGATQCLQRNAKKGRKVAAWEFWKALLKLKRSACRLASRLLVPGTPGCCFVSLPVSGFYDCLITAHCSTLLIPLPDTVEVHCRLQPAPCKLYIVGL